MFHTIPQESVREKLKFFALKTSPAFLFPFAYALLFDDRRGFGLFSRVGPGVGIVKIQ